MKNKSLALFALISCVFNGLQAGHHKDHKSKEHKERKEQKRKEREEQDRKEREQRLIEYHREYTRQHKERQDIIERTGKTDPSGKRLFPP